ncbi:NEDD8 ultimate buster 1-like protein [Corchorus capsularis]|uniref:NEDD8 ultimate buster 1-like protein n=1 Tax=Corchorus capsularis TaxID=210143 RepID=A0A1R3I0J4_COCAP|nr:NEDD8 ultimate buster 1-like protein [Corchorus capsularis]
MDRAGSVTGTSKLAKLAIQNKKLQSSRTSVDHCSCRNVKEEGEKEREGKTLKLKAAAIGVFLIMFS